MGNSNKNNIHQIHIIKMKAVLIVALLCIGALAATSSNKEYM